MSQVSIIDIEGNHPQIPIRFNANDGFAIPIANVLEILSAVVPAGTTPTETVGSGNTITTNIQTSQAIAASDASNIGLSAFDSAAFSVDANGFVTLNGGGGATTNIDVDASTAPGTDPVVPNVMGNITITGGQVAPGTIGSNVIRTNSLAANALTIQIQRSSAQGASTLTANGVSHFNSSEFTVDSDGFVSLIGGSLAVDSVGVQTGTNPIVPTGAGLITINGAVVAAGTNPIRTDGTGANTMAVEVQISQAIAATDATKIGLSNFNSSHFSVDANGFVSLSGGGLAIDSIAVQTGTSPIAPTAAGLVTINGAVVAAGTNPIRTNGTGANTMALQVQIAQALAATDATKIGLANFDSAAFDVDANGFVQLNGGGIAATSFDVQANTVPGTDPVVPTAAGVVTVNGAAVANHSVVLETRSRAANAYNLEVQYATSAAATDATKSGVAHFDSTDFTVDANGFVALAGAGAGQTITGNSGGALPPSSGNWNIQGSGSITTSGSGSTLTVSLTGLTNHAILVGAGTATITKVGPSATAGQIFQSAGAAADPVFSTATYPSTAGSAGKILISDGTNIVSSTPTYPNSATGTGTILRADGTNWVATTATYPTTTTANQLLVSTAANVVGGLTAGTNNSILMGVTGAVPVFTTTGTPYVTGISFDAGSNTLSTYSTGTFTPTITGSGSNPTPTYTAQNGYYTKIGKVVFFSCFISVSALTGGTGNLQVSGMPFTSENQTNEKGFFIGATTINTNLIRSWYFMPANGTLCTVLTTDTALLALPQTTLTVIQFGGSYQATS